MKPKRCLLLIVLTMFLLAEVDAQPVKSGSMPIPPPFPAPMLGTISGHVYLRPIIPWGPAPYQSGLMIVILNEYFEPFRGSLPGVPPPVPGSILNERSMPSKGTLPAISRTVPGPMPFCCPPQPGCPCMPMPPDGAYRIGYQFTMVPFEKYRIGLAVPDSLAMATGGISGSLRFIAYASADVYSVNQADTSSARLLKLSPLNPSASDVDVYFAEECP